jgi:FeS assembly SUF system protein
MPTKEEVMEALKDVIDPELGMNVVELGLIYDVQVEDEGRKIKVKMTLTVPGCPLAQVITEYVGRRIHQMEGVENVDVELTFDPPWSPEMMSPEARARLGL